MNLNGEILIIEGDADDRNLIEMAIRDIQVPNTVILLESAAEALDYLSVPGNNPFMIISDVNMPKMNGLELRETIAHNPKLNAKCIPYIFLSTSDSDEIVKQAFKTSVQGYFKKPNDYDDFKRLFVKIVDYWKDSKSPAAH